LSKFEVAMEELLANYDSAESEDEKNKEAIVPVKTLKRKANLPPLPESLIGTSGPNFKFH
jgi:hypothetical protein